MNNKEAIEILQNAVVIPPDFRQAIGMGVEALEKQSPCTPTVDHGVYYCDCQFIVYPNWHYCPHCGRRVDWEE